MIYPVIVAVTLLAGFIQGVSGFGAGIVIMSVIPYFLGVVSSATLSNFLSIFLCLLMVIRYRKGIRVRMILLPAAFFLAGSFTALHFVTEIDTTVLKMILGAFLVVVAVYFMKFSSRVHLKADIPTMAFCGLISGLCDGFFAIGGPLMVLYFLAITKTKEEYLGTIQSFFLSVLIINFGVRCSRGLVTADLMSWAVVGLVAIVAGLWAGGKVIDRVNDAAMRKLTYALIGVSGAVTFVTAWLAM